MKIFYILIAAFTVIAIIGMVSSWHACETKGGTVVRTAYGEVCAKLEGLK